MIKESKILKICAIAICALLYNSSVAFSEQVTTTTDVVTDGEVSSETTTGYATGGSSGGSGSNSRLSDEEIASREADEEREAMEDAENVNFSNLYNGRPLFPEAMMIYCKVNAEDLAADLTKIEECIKKYIKAINNDNSAVKTQGLHDYDVMRYQALNDTLTNATDKLKSIRNFEDTTNDYAGATNDSNTQRDTEAAIANSQAFATNVINNLRELYAEKLKLQALEGIRNVDPSAILTEEEYQESKTSVTGSTKTETGSTSVGSDSVINPSGSGGGTGAGSGTGASNDTGNNSGENNDSNENAAVEGQSDHMNAYSIEDRVHQLSNLEPEDLATHGYEIDSLRTEAQKVLNDPNATESDKAVARRAISDLNTLFDEVADYSRKNK